MQNQLEIRRQEQRQLAEEWRVPLTKEVIDRCLVVAADTIRGLEARRGWGEFIPSPLLQAAG